MNQRSKRVIKGVCIGVCLLVCVFLVYMSWGGKKASKSAQEEMTTLILGQGEVEENGDSVDIIRDYIYTQMEWAFAEELYNDAGNLVFEDNVLWEDKIYELCLPDTIESPGYCDGVAYVLSTVYNMLGYKSCRLDMAVFDDMGDVVDSHVVTLVYLDGEWIVEDATFNLTFKKNGEHVSIHDLIQSVRENNMDDIEVVQGDNRWRRGVFTEPEYDEGYLLKKPKEFIEFDDGYYSYVEMTMETWMDMVALDAYFERDGYATDMLSIYGYPYNIYLTKNSLMNRIERRLLIKELQDLTDGTN